MSAPISSSTAMNTPTSGITTNYSPLSFLPSIPKPPQLYHSNNYDPSSSASSLKPKRVSVTSPTRVIGFNVMKEGRHTFIPSHLQPSSPMSPKFTSPTPLIFLPPPKVEDPKSSGQIDFKEQSQPDIFDNIPAGHIFGMDDIETPDDFEQGERE